MGFVSVTKEWTFDCAHLLDKHEGLCSNLHGHTYKLQVEIGNTEGLITEGPASGMVIDFSDLKRRVKEVVVDKFDHSVILFEHSECEFEQELIKLAIKHKKRTVLLDDRPTAENMVIIFAGLIKEIFRDTDYFLASVKLWETPTSFATWIADPEEV